MIPHDEVAGLVLRMDAATWSIEQGRLVPGDTLRELAEAVDALAPDLDSVRRLDLSVRLERLIEALGVERVRIQALLAKVRIGRRAMKGYAASSRPAER